MDHQALQKVVICRKKIFIMTILASKIRMKYLKKMSIENTYRMLNRKMSFNYFSDTAFHSQWLSPDLAANHFKIFSQILQKKKTQTFLTSVCEFMQNWKYSPKKDFEACIVYRNIPTTIL